LRIGVNEGGLAQYKKRMMGDMVTVGTILALVFGAAVLVALLWSLISWRRQRERQARLDTAFQRSRKVSQSGSGLQGTPYSVYGEAAWHDHTTENR
jgi:hypothetical protein